MQFGCYLCLSTMSVWYFLMFFFPCLQLKEVQVQVTESTTALKEVTTILSETRRRYQALEIELQSALSLVRPFYAALQ